MKLELPGWISAREPNRSRNFMVVKVVLFICLVVEVIETLLYSPIYYKIIEEETKQAPVGEDYNVWIVILSTILSVAFGLAIISIGMYHLYDDYRHLVTHFFLDRNYWSIEGKLHTCSPLCHNLIDCHHCFFGNIFSSNHRHLFSNLKLFRRLICSSFCSSHSQI